MNARRAIWRWSWRVLRKEWRDQIAIAVLVAGSVALCVVGAMSAFHVAQPEESLDSGVQLFLNGDQQLIDAFATDDNFGALKRASIAVQGSAQVVAVRTFDPANPILSPLLELTDGQLPIGEGQTALTRGLSEQLAKPIGSTVELDGLSLDVVGLVENPTDLNDHFLFVDDNATPPVEFGTTYLTDWSVDAIERAVPRALNVGISEATPTRSVVVLLANIGITLGMMLVGLLASASFGVLAQRRMRQFGMLSAIGANQRQIRGAAAFNGFVLGVCSAGAGAALGVAAAFLIVPQLEAAAGHRMNFTVPLSIVATAVVVAVAACTVAAWIPARSISRQSIVEVLAARRPRSRPNHSLSGFGVALTVAGFVWLARSATSQSLGGAIGSISLIVVGVLLLTPAAIAFVGRAVASASLPMRIAGRDLARFQTRSASALGAIVIALAVPLGVGVTTASLDARTSTAAPNLDSTTAILWASGVDRTSGELAMAFDSPDAEVAVEQALALDPTLKVARIDVPVDVEATIEQNDAGIRVRRARGVVSPIDCDSKATGSVESYSRVDGRDLCFRNHQTWLLTPDLAAMWGIEVSGTSDPASVVRLAGEYRLAQPDLFDDDGSAVRRIDTSVGGIPDFESLPFAVISPELMGPAFEPMTVGWLLQSPQPLEPAFLADLRESIQGGAELEALTEPPGGRTNLRIVFALAGLVVGLTILGATVILVRGEGADGTRILAVLGAAPSVRRSVASYTAGLLALAGAVLSIPLGYIGLVVARASEGDLPFAIPWSTILILVVGFPVLAAGTSGLFTRSQPVGLGRSPVL